MSCLLALVTAFAVSGCALTWNSTPIMSESNGETVVANANTLKLGFGNKEATSIGAYSLSADGGLSISNQNEQNDNSATFMKGLEVGERVAALYLGRGGASAGSAAPPAVQQEAAAVPVSPPSAAASGKLSEAMSAAKASGKPLVVVAGNVGCGYCARLDAALDASPGFTGRADLVLYRETSKWESNAAGKWTGGGAFPVLRVTQWDSSGNIVCDKTVNRPQSVADIEAVLSACSAPK